MSNKINLVQREVKEIRTGRKYKEAFLSDDYDYGSIELDKFFEEDFDFLRDLVEKSHDPDIPFPDGMLSLIGDIVAEHKGMCIDDTWYEWEEIKSIIADG